MMVKWHEINKNLIRTAQVKMARRSVSAAPFHYVLFALLMFYVPELRNQGWQLWALSGLVVVTTLGRITLWRFSERVFGLRRGPVIWRLIFGGCSVGLGIAWGLAQGMTFSHYMEHTESFLALAICMGILTASIPTYSFDLVVNVLFQIAIMAPAMVVLGMSGVPAMVAVGVMLFVGVIFTSIVARSLHNSQVELLVNQEIIEKQNQSIESAHKELSRNHDLIQTMLESIEEAFIILDLDGVCVNEPSAVAREFFGIDPKGQNLVAILRIGESDRKNLDSWFFILKSDRFDFRETAGRGPKVFINSGTKKTLALKYQPIRDKDGGLKAIVMTAVDVTREVAAQKAEKEALEKSELILRVNENRNGFREFLEHFERAIDKLSDGASHDLGEVRQQLHTLKGTSAIFGAKSLSHEVHGVEMEIRKSETKVTEAAPLKAEKLSGGIFETHMRHLKEQFSLWKQREMQLFVQLGIFEEEKIEFSKRRLAELEQDFVGDNLESFKRILNKLTESEFGEQLKDYSFHVSQVAGKLAKQVSLQVKREGDLIFSAPETFREVVRSLVHLFNNAVDHGIEIPEERVAVGKPASGSIVATYGLFKDDAGRPWIKLNIQDDGRGINVAKLRERARARGDDVTAKSDLEIMHMVFEEGVTTRDTVTEVSGQGVGMGALKATILKARGRIKITKSDAHGTTFEISLPVPKEKPKAAASSMPAAS